MTDNRETLHFLDYWRVISSRKEIVIAVSLLVVVTGIAVTYAMPKVYSASAVIRVQKETPDVKVFSPELMQYDPLFMRTQFEIIQSRPIIEEVVRRRDLDKKFAKAYQMEQLPPALQLDQAYKILSRRMKVQQYRDTNLIEIQIFLSEPKDSARFEAAAAANMVASVYESNTSGRSRRVKEGALRALHDSWQEQEKRVSELQKEAEAIRQKYAINVVDPGSASRMSLDRMTLMHLEELRIQMSHELADKESRHKLVASLSAEKMLEAAPYLLKDPILSSLVAQKRESEVNLSQLLNAYGENHPNVVRVKSVIEQLDQKIGDALGGLRMGVMAEYDAAKAKLKIIEDELAEKKISVREMDAGAYNIFNEAMAALDHARKIRDALELRYLQEDIELRIPHTTVELIEEAKPSAENDHVSPNFPLNVALSIIVGLGVGIGLAYFVEYLDTSVKSIEDIESAMALPVLGVIPQKVRPLIEEGANPAHAESYRILRTNIQFAEKFKGGKSLCFTSGSMGEGKSLTLFNLACVCAQLGDRVIVIDSDLHRPRQHRMFKVSNKVGLANVLIGEMTLDSVIVPNAIPNLDFLPSGKLDSGVHGLLDTQRMRSLVADLKSRYDMVLFDAPPIIGVSDASVLAREVDGVMLLIQHRKYPKAVSMRAKGMLDNMGAKVLGVVLNNINISREQSYYYYHQYYYQSEYTNSRKRAS